MNRIPFAVRLRYLLVLGLPVLAGCARTQAQPPMPDPEVTVCKPESKKEVLDYEDFPGRLEAVNSIDLRARVTGYLDKINFKEGDEVKKGDILFEIDPRSYEADLARAEGNVVQTGGHLRRLEADYDRTAALFPKGTISREEYDKTVGDRAEAKGANDVALADREMARLNLSWTKVRSPIDGRVSRRYLDPGNLVKATDTVLTTIVSLDPIYAYFDLDERTALRWKRLIKSGKIAWSLDAHWPVELGLADEEGFSLHGTIDFADNRVDMDTGTWRLRALVKNADRALAPGLFVRVRLPIGKPYTPLLVCEQALGTDQGQKYVLLVKKVEKTGADGAKTAVDQVEYCKVKVGRLHEGLRVIESGLTKDDRVIVGGLQRVRPGVAVKVVDLQHMPIITGADGQMTHHGVTESTEKKPKKDPN
jgi:RND family efflux transporter MFP subunit